MDEGKTRTRELRKRYIELAGMCKEKKRGTVEELHGIVTKFALQEGVRKDRAEEYLELLIGADLIVLTNGQKRWKYNSDAEWELFKVNI